MLQHIKQQQQSCLQQLKAAIGKCGKSTKAGGENKSKRSGKGDAQGKGKGPDVQCQISSFDVGPARSRAQGATR